MQSPRLLNHKTTLFSFAVLALLFLITGCVSTSPEQYLDIGDMPSDKAAIFIAVTWEAPGGNTDLLSIEFDSETSVQLIPEAVNKMYIDPGWYHMNLAKLSQPDDNAQMRYRFDPSRVYRYTIIERESQKPDTLAPDDDLTQLTYVVAPATSDALEQLLIEEAYPVKTVNP